MRPQFDGRDVLGPLEREPGLEDVRGKDFSLEQELVIGFQGIERLSERARDGLDALLPLVMQLVEILVDRRGARSRAGR